MPVYLGVTDEERHAPQHVSLDVAMWFANPPKACMTDHINDTICYAGIITAVQNNIGDRPFRLIEHLGYDIYHLIHSLLPKSAKISVKITKRPKVAGFDGNVQFHLADN